MQQNIRQPIRKQESQRELEREKTELKQSLCDYVTERKPATDIFRR